MATSKLVTADGKKRIMQNFLLIWCDQYGHSDKDDTQYTLTKLREAVNEINLFTKIDETITFLEKLKKEKAFLIVSGSLGQKLVPQVHKLKSLNSIFIFCENIDFHSKWSKDYHKIKGVFNRIENVCECMKKAARRTDEDMTAISYAKVNKNTNNFDAEHLDPSFMYTQILKNILLSMDHDVQERQELVQFCKEKFAGNSYELRIINEFSKSYQSSKAIWWYTRQSFLYQVLNRSLRLLEVDLILLMGFFIQDLYRQLKQLHDKQISSYANKTFEVYRGQALAKKDYAQLEKTRNGLMSFNCFVSTSKTDKVAKDMAIDSAEDEENVGIFFVMKIDPKVKSSPFAAIRDLSEFASEDEVLFSMHTVFRITTVEPLGEHENVYKVELNLIGDADPDLTLLSGHIENEVGGVGWERISHLLIKMGELNKAEEIYRRCLKDASDPLKRATYSHQLAVIKHQQGKHGEAIQLYQEALAIRQAKLEDDNIDIAASYTGLGTVYMDQYKHADALKYFEKDYQITSKKQPVDKRSLATSLTNIGAAYESMGKLWKALPKHTEALELRRECLPENHADIANSHNNIGLVHYHLDDNQKALENYKKALKIYNKTLTAGHVSFATIHNNIGCVYRRMEKYPEAADHYQQAIEIFEKLEDIPAAQLQKVKESLEYVKSRIPK